MSLKIQIISFQFSIIYGIISYIIYSKVKKIMYSKNIKIEILNNLFFTLILTLVYFKIFIYINNGINNIYFLILTVLRFVYISYTNFTKKM